MEMMRMGIRMRLIGLIVLPPACALANDRIISVLPSVASMVPSESAACKRESKALLKHDAEAADWHHTQWDVEIVASAGTFIAIGIPQERALLEEVRRINPSLKVVDAGVGVQKIADNPYFFVSTENREKMMKNLRSAYSCDDLVVCGNPLQPRTSIYSGFGFKSKSYTVAIAHPAFAYECLDCGVGTVMLDVGRLNEDAHYRKEQIDILIRRRANIVLKLPGSRGPSSEFLAESRLREVEFDIFDTRLWLPGVLYENLQRREEELEHKEELSRMYASTLLKGIRFESFDIRGGESLAQLLDRIQAVLDAAVDINLPIEKRKLNLDFSGAPAAVSKCLSPASLAHVSGLDVLRYACRTIGCDFTFSTPWIADEESLRTLYIIVLETKE